MILKQVDSLIHTVSKGVQFLLLCTGIMAILMLFASLYAHLDERKRDALLFRIIGASKQTISAFLLTEFAIIGFCAGLIGSIAALALYLWLAQAVFIFPLYAWRWIFLGPILGMVFIAFIAWLGLRKVVQASPKQLIRNN